MNSIRFWISTFFCKHRTIVHFNSTRRCMFCKVTVPEEYSADYSTIEGAAA